MKAMPQGVVPVATGDPGIFVSAPVLPIENSLTTFYDPSGELLHAWGTYTKLPEGSMPICNP